MNIIFAGTPEFAAQSLSAIIGAGHHVIAVYTQPDRPAGRGKKLLKSDVKLLAEAHSISVYQPESLKDPMAQQELKALSPDIMVVAAYGLLLPPSVLEIPTFGCINIHASLLPRWRGAAPIQRSIQSGDTETGITLMQMDEGLDTGNMLLKSSTKITPEDNGGTLHDRLAKMGANAILDYLQRFNNDANALQKLTGEKQNDALANYAKKLSKQEAEINWQDEAQQISLTIRAFNPWPVAFFQTNGTRVRLLEAEFIRYNGAEPPGTIIERNKAGILVTCGKDAIRILTLQLAGAKVIDVQSFVNGGKPILSVGDSLFDGKES